MLPGGFWVSIRETIRTQVKWWQCLKHEPVDRGMGWIECQHCGKPMMK